MSELKPFNFTSWDFECPKCNAQWNNEGDSYSDGDEVEEQCPKCDVALLVTATYSVDYDVRLKEPELLGTYVPPLFAQAALKEDKEEK
jgi:hypothetical protein